MDILMNVIIYGLCTGATINKIDFEHPLNAQEVHGIQSAAEKCRNIYKTCLKNVDVKRFEIGGSHLGITCE